tara:strand:- start:503 stop:697 length:195 start_codon:yes stop_codon:yes gene_type:complete
MKKNIADNVALIEEMLKSNKPSAWHDYAQLKIWERGYLIGLLANLMDQTYIVKQEVNTRIKNEN